MNVAQNTAKADVNFLKEELHRKNKKIADLEEQIAWFKRQIFGKKSERVVENVNSEQLFFEGFEPMLPQEKEAKAVKEHTRKQPNRNGQDKITLSPDLPVETTVLDIPEDEKVCKETGEPLVQIGAEVTHKLAHKPGSYYIKEIIRPKYANPKKEEEGIKTASLPEGLFSKCRADESFLVSN